MQFKVKGFDNKRFEIVKNAKYLIRAVVPSDIGSSYKEAGIRIATTFNYPQEVVRCPATIANGYDFGLDSTSIDFAGDEYTEDLIDELMEGREDYIASFKKVYGNKIDLSNPENVKHWDSWKYELFYNRIVETSNERDFVNLCLAFRSGMIVPLKYQDTPQYKDKGWVSIENISEKDENSQTTESRRIGIKVALFKMLTEDKNLLCHIVNFFDKDGETIESTTRNELIVARLDNLLKDANMVDKIYEALGIGADYSYSIDAKFKNKAEVHSMMKILRYKGIIRKSATGTLLGSKTLPRNDGDAIKEILDDSILTSLLYATYDEYVDKMNVKLKATAEKSIASKKTGRKGTV